MITEDLMAYLENLSRVSLSQGERERIRRDLEAILTYMNHLNTVDTTAAEPMSHVIPIFNVFREDEVTNGDEREAVLANAPAKKDGAFQVPKTVE